MSNKKMVDIYGMWQTDALIYKVAEDGSLPRNEYGNWEVILFIWGRQGFLIRNLRNSFHFQ